MDKSVAIAGLCLLLASPLSHSGALEKHAVPSRSYPPAPQPTYPAHPYLAPQPGMMPPTRTTPPQLDSDQLDTIRIMSELQPATLTEWLADFEEQEQQARREGNTEALRYYQGILNWWYRNRGRGQ